jgi:cytochrome c553
MKHREAALLVLSVLVSGTAAAAPAAAAAAVKRGDYLVSVMGCNDCHTPWKMGPTGPAPDMTRLLSGHPAELKMPPAPDLGKGPWMMTAAATRTAWAGPWGVSYTANLTPDPETGLGKWTEKQFIAAIRTGKHEGKGRPILPPMPWEVYKNASDADLKAIFAYLRSLTPVKNAVPQPLEPPAPPAPAAPPR